MVIIAIIGAIAVGWIYESRSKDLLTRPDLEIPTDIDFFLSSMAYRVFDKSGNLNYQLQSPYLEHFVKDDISRIKQPEIRVLREESDWLVKASHGEILHSQEWLKLEENVILKKIGTETLKVQSESMLFKPELDLIVSEATVTMESDSANISGDQAIFDLRREIFSLKNTRAIYYHADS